MTRRRPTVSTAALTALLLAAGVGVGIGAQAVAAPHTADPHTADPLNDAPLARATAPLRTAHSPGAVVADLTPAVGACHYRTAGNGGILPDPACTPGAIDPAVTQETIAATICRPGWTDTIRPPSSVTKPWKDRSSSAYNTGEDGNEYDHLVSLQLGGANATSNLWVEPDRYGRLPNEKDTVEGRLHALVCSGQMLLAEAQHRIATDWTTALAGTRYAAATGAPPAGTAPTE